MEHVKSYFSALDAAVQGRFDRCIFFLMRIFGWKKSFIRFILWGIAITALAINTYCQWLLNGRKVGGGVVGGIALLGLLLLIQLADYVLDRYAESMKMFSSADRIDSSYGFFKLIFGSIMLQHLLIVVVLLFAASPKSGEEFLLLTLRVDAFSGLVFYFFVLATIYLKRTPPEPPPTKVELRILVPVRDSSS